MTLDNNNKEVTWYGRDTHPIQNGNSRPCGAVIQRQTQIYVLYAIQGRSPKGQKDAESTAKETKSRSNMQAIEEQE